MTAESGAANQNLNTGLLPLGLETLIKQGLTGERLSYDEADAILEEIAQAATIRKLSENTDPHHLSADQRDFLEKAEHNRHRLASSYLPLVIGRAHYAHQTWNGCTRLEDYIQAGVEGLYDGIEHFTRLEARERFSFIKYAKITIKRAMIAQRNRDMFTTEIDDALQNFWADYKKLQAAVNAPEGTASPVSAETAWVIGNMVSTYRKGNLEFDATRFENEIIDEYHPSVYDSGELSPKLEKALLLLTKTQRYIIQQLFGLIPENPVMFIDELSQASNLSENDLRNRRYIGVTTLRQILEGFDEYGTDLRKWPREKASRFSTTKFNVLSYLHRAGLGVPEDKSVQELRITAMSDLERRNAPDKYKMVARGVYDLTGEGLTSEQLAQKHGYSPRSITDIANKIFSYSV